MILVAKGSLFWSFLGVGNPGTKRFWCTRSAFTMSYEDMWHNQPFPLTALDNWLFQVDDFVPVGRSGRNDTDGNVPVCCRSEHFPNVTLGWRFFTTCFAPSATSNTSVRESHTCFFCNLRSSQLVFFQASGSKLRASFITFDELCFHYHRWSPTLLSVFFFNFPRQGFFPFPENDLHWLFSQHWSKAISQP